MIKLQQYTPDVYYRESRDFQYIGRLYDLVLNYVKTNIDLLYNLPFNDLTDDQFIDLLALTLGFKAKHKYTAKHLRAICSCFSEILRNKGTIKSLLLACSAIYHSEGITEQIDYELTDKNGKSGGTTNLILYLSPKLNDTTLLLDLLDYVLPAGMNYSIIKVLTENRKSNTEIASADTLKIYETDSSIEYANNNLAVIPQYTNENIEKVTQMQAEDTVGIIANSSVYKPEDN